MSTIFYAITFLFIMYETYILFHPEEIALEREITHQNKGYISILLLINLPYFIWCIVGLFGAEWRLFMTMLFLTGFSTIFRILAGTDRNKQNHVSRIDAFVSIVLLTFIVLNHFADAWPDLR